MPASPSSKQPMPGQHAPLIPAPGSAPGISPVSKPSQQLPPAQCADAELLVDLLAPALPHSQALRWARRLLQKADGLRGLLGLSQAELLALPGMEPVRVRQLHVVREIFRRQLQQQLRSGIALSSPAMALDYLQASLKHRSREIFTCLFLDTRHRVIACEELFQGSIDGACVYPRVVAERALRLGAAALIVAHNHPSGVAEPSLADQAITRRLRDALALLEIRLLDHFVIGDGEPVSLASRGLL